MKQERVPFDQINFETLKVNLNSGVLFIVLNRPEHKNAINKQMLLELSELLTMAKSDHAVRIVQLQSLGNVFCSGADLSELKQLRQDVKHNDSETASRPLFLQDYFKQLNKPIVVILEGDVLAGGFLFLLHATYVIAHPKVKFCLPEIQKSLFPFQVLVGLMDFIPHKKVIDWCITARKFDAVEALSSGLITHISTQTTVTAQELYNIILPHSAAALNSGYRVYQNERSKRNRSENDKLYKELIALLLLKKSNYNI